MKRSDWQGEDTATAYRFGLFPRIELFILLCIPVAHALINHAWVFSQIGWLDPWYYLGYSLNYRNPNFMDDYYKISRLPWILIEYTIRHIFDYFYASFALQFLLMWTTIVFLYGALFSTLGRRAAFFGVLFFAAYIFSYASGGADYHNSCGGAFFALSWFCAVRAAQSKASRPWLVATGIAIALSVNSIVVMANLVPIPFAFYILHYRNLHGHWPPFVKTALWGALGAVLITALLCAINWYVGRNPWFFLLQFKLATNFVTNSAEQRPWWHDWSTPWYLEVMRLYLWPAAAGLVLGILLAVRTWYQGGLSEARGRMLALYFSCCAFYGVLWISWQSAGQTALDWVYFAYPLIFPLTGLVAAAAAAYPKFFVFRGVSFTLVALLSACLVLAPFAFYPAFDFQFTVPQRIAIIIIAFTVMVIALTCLSNRVTLLVAACAMSLVTYVSAADVIPLFGRGTCLNSERNFAAIQEAHLLLRAKGLPSSSVFIWGDSFETFPGAAGCSSFQATIALSNFYPSLVSTGFQYLSAPWDAVKEEDIPQKRYQTVGSAKGLVVQVTNNADRAMTLYDNFKKAGVAVSPEGPQNMALKNVPVQLYYFDVGPAQK